MLSGNKALFCIDTAGTVIFRKQYTMMLGGVGSEVNKVVRASKLCDGTIIVAGWQGGDDFLYDFTQLTDGRLVFVGKKYNTSSEAGVWTFVTDSTGKEILWEKQTKIIYRTTDGTRPRPLSVCATPDSGFTIAGDYGCGENDGEMNGFVSHFIHAPPTAAASVPGMSKVFEVHCTLSRSKVMFTFQRTAAVSAEISIFNAAGKLATRLSTGRAIASSTSLVWDASGSGRGVYFYRVKSDVLRAKGKLVLN